MRGAGNVPFVLDASVAACWYFEDEHDGRADRVLDLLAIDTALTPLHWWFEIRNVIVVGERRRRMAEPYAASYLAELQALPIALAALPEEGDVFALARKHRLTFYDAAYLELAQREQLPLATLDDNLAAAARAEGVVLVTAPR
jgi:predicted nucleic acid-binding protein